jgi:plasmid stabilization system protein ParE
VRALAFHPRARDDLRDILAYIAADQPQRAIEFVADLERFCAALVDFRERYGPRPLLPRGVRLAPYRGYSILYVANARRVRIERILHGARDLRPTLTDR